MKWDRLQSSARFVAPVLPILLAIFGVDDNTRDTLPLLLKHLIPRLAIAMGLLLMVRWLQACRSEGRLKMRRLVSSDAVVNVFVLGLLFFVRSISFVVGSKFLSLTSIALGSFLILFLLGMAVSFLNGSGEVKETNKPFHVNWTGPQTRGLLFGLVLLDWGMKFMFAWFSKDAVAFNFIQYWVPYGILFVLLIFSQTGWLMLRAVSERLEKPIPVGLVFMFSGAMANMSDVFGWGGALDPITPMGGIMNLADVFLLMGAAFLGADAERVGRLRNMTFIQICWRFWSEVRKAVAILLFQQKRLVQFRKSRILGWILSAAIVASPFVSTLARLHLVPATGQVVRGEPPVLQFDWAARRVGNLASVEMKLQKLLVSPNSKEIMVSVKQSLQNDSYLFKYITQLETLRATVERGEIIEAWSFAPPSFPAW